MPKYDYRCLNCGSIKELRVGMSHLVVESFCSECGLSASKFVRVFSPSKNFILKNGGWAKDGYNKSSKKKEKKVDGGDS